MGHYKVGKTKKLKQRLNQYNGDKKDDIIPLYVYETDDIDEIERCIKHYAKKYKYRKYVNKNKKYIFFIFINPI